MPKIAYTLLLVPLLAAACQTLTEPLEGPAAFEGTVATVASSNPGRFQMRIETVQAIEDPGARFPDPVTVYFGEGTKIFRRDGGELKVIEASDVEIGEKVRIWIGAELRSDPLQYGASQVVVQPRS